MTITSGISLLAQSQSQSSRLNDLRALMDNLQRQVSTQKKYDTYSGFGADSFNLQRMRGAMPRLQGYIDNIDRSSARIDLMGKSMAKISDLGSQLLSVINNNLRGDTFDTATVRQVAQNGLQFIQDLLNQQYDGQYLFAGSDVSNPPFTSASTLSNNFSNQIAGWLAGAIDNNQIIANTTAFAGTDLGLSPTLAAAGNRTIRVGDNTDLDYTVKADQACFQDILRALAFAANISAPDPQTDAATKQQFNDLVGHIAASTQSAIAEVRTATAQLSSKFALLDSIKKGHTDDLNLMAAQVDKLENADTTAALVGIQALQTQLSASYQVTRIVSQLSLVNYLPS